jgi:DNA-binding MarR family transcriptional regulator
MKKNSFLYFLASTEKISAQFTEYEKKILYAIIRQGNEAPFRVIEVISMHFIASQATLHNTLKKLIERGYLAVKPSKEDGRIKYIVTTNKTWKLLEQLDSLLRISAA